jgi:hypothetical protein
MRGAAIFSKAIPVLSFFLPSVLGALPGLPSKIYGVNLGSWLLLESWMLPQEWLNMGGQQCDDCSTCIATELYIHLCLRSWRYSFIFNSAFAKAFPKTVDKIFAGHW